MRRRGRTDRNHPQIVRELRVEGVSVVSTADMGDGFPDIVCGVREQNYMFEIKDPLEKPSKRKLTDDELCWHKQWRGQVHVIETSEDALRIMGLLR